MRIRRQTSSFWLLLAIGVGSALAQSVPCQLQSNTYTCTNPTVDSPGTVCLNLCQPLPGADCVPCVDPSPVCGQAYPGVIGPWRTTYTSHDFVTCEAGRQARSLSGAASPPGYTVAVAEPPGLASAPVHLVYSLGPDLAAAGYGELVNSIAKPDIDIALLSSP